MKTSPSLRDKEEARITVNERTVLEVLAGDYDTSGWDETGFWSFKPLMKKTGLEHRQVRLACRSLARKGLAKFMKGLVDGDGMMAGAGYGASKEGAALIKPCDDCGGLATYDWWEKDGEQVVTVVEGAVHIRKCDEHYKS